MMNRVSEVGAELCEEAGFDKGSGCGVNTLETLGAHMSDDFERGI